MKSITTMKDVRTKNLMPAVFLTMLVLSMGFGLAASEKLSMSGNAIEHVSDKIKTRGNTASLSDIDSESDADSATFGSDNLKKASSEIDSSVGKGAKESTFAQVSMGQGWAVLSGDVNSSEGNFARIFWVKKTFANSANTTSTDVTKVKGELKIGSDMYKLNLTSETANAMVFSVTGEKDKTSGTLTLNMGKSLVGFTVWSGTLVLDSGKSYDINVATKNSKVKGMGEGAGVGNDSGKDKSNNSDNKNSNGQANGQGKKAGLFEKMKGWFSKK